MLGYRAITTYYQPATDTEGAAIVATVEGLEPKYYSMQYDVSIEQNHQRAAILFSRFHGALGRFVGAWNHNTMVWVSDTNHKSFTFN